MNLLVRLGAISTMALCAGFCFGQAAPPKEDQSRPVQTPADLPTQVERQKKPPVDPPIIEDGGLSIEPLYWFNRQLPSLHTGHAATADGNFDYGDGGKSKDAMGVELGIPAGRANTLRISYFRTQGNANSTATDGQLFFGESYNAGDYLSGGYHLQAAKISWDYLSYTWYRPSTKIRLKTLYEVQYVNIGTTISAPFKPPTTDTSGDVDSYIATGNKSLILPSLGLELEANLGKYLRWEVKGSGFTLPHRSAIGDAQAVIAIKAGHNIELIGGERFFYFKTSPKSDSYLKGSLYGAFVGVRYYWGRQQ